MLKSFYIKGLYGLYTYRLELNRGVFIITGPNGFGKTTILNSINAIYDCEFWRFFFLKFDVLCASFDGGNFVELKRKDNNEEIQSGDSLSDINVKLCFHGFGVEEEFDVSSQYIYRLVRYRARREHSNIEEYLDGNYLLKEDEILQKAVPSLISFLKDKHCTYLESQRLVYGKKDSLGNQVGIAYTIDDVNDYIKRTYLKAQNDFSKTAQTIDGSFIKRLSQLIEKKNQIDRSVSASDLHLMVISR